MLRLWARGLLARRLPRLVAGAAGIALAIALLGVIGLFSAASRTDMTERALRGLPVDWQVVVAPGADAATVGALLERGVAPLASGLVDYAAVQGFTAATGGTTQTTGAGVVLGLPPGYLDRFPGQMRVLAGLGDGVLIAQQAAANLHVVPGDPVSIAGPDGQGATVRIDGVVDLPNADALFQATGPAKTSQPAPPPDDVLLVSAARWAALFGPAETGAPAAPLSGAPTSRQIHVRLDHSVMSGDPMLAYRQALGRAQHFEVMGAGSAIVANNLAARLDAVRGDALYSGVLVLFLGSPGAVLAVLLTVALQAVGRDRRRREQALLRLRGASRREVLATAGIEALVVATMSGVAGCGLALALAAALGYRMDGTAGTTWLAVATVLGFTVALTSVLWPAWADLRQVSVSEGRRSLARESEPVWLRLELDLLSLVLAAVLYWRIAATGYQVVLAPEGVPAAAVDYPAFLAPLALWVGGGLTALRLCRSGLRRGRSVLAGIVTPFAPRLGDTIAAATVRERGRISAAIVLSALAISFGIAVASFGATYARQARVDAELTNGADVTVTGSATAPAGLRIDAIRAVPGVVDVQPLHHRRAYVGHDLQDLFGVDAKRIGNATTIADAYVADRDAAGTMARLAATPDGILVSQETINDFQLAIGDPLKLQLPRSDGVAATVPFHVVGVVNEFPTAPRDSFLVANAAYLAAATGNAAAEVLLIRTAGPPDAAAAGIRDVLGPASALKVTDLGQASRIIGSSLVAVDLRHITDLELGFAVVLVAASTGLMLGLGFLERRRTPAILWALGASRSVAARFLWTEGLLLLAVSIPIGCLLGLAVSNMTVKLLSGVFDPPPDAAIVPWVFMTVVTATAIVSAMAAVLWAAGRRQSRTDLGTDLAR